MKYLLLVLLCTALSGCGSVSTTHRPASYFTQNPISQVDEPLFGQISNELNESDIERILNYQLALPANNRIAILRLSSDATWQQHSSEFAELNSDLITGFVNKLRDSPRVYDASFLPSLLVPKQRTVNSLREAAARYQADLLLAYRTSCQTYEKFRFIEANEAKAFCTVEAIVLDVRSGIIPFTSVVSETYNAVSDASDMDSSETLHKTQMSSVSKAMSKIADQFNAFILRIKTR